MSRARAAFWGLAAVTAVLWLVMAVLFWLRATPQGLVPFDFRVLGYDLEAARRYLEALSAKAAGFYLGSLQILDSVFPALFAATLAIALFWASAGLPRAARVLVAVVPIAGGATDYRENAAVAAMLVAGPEGLSAALVEAASRWTVVKYLFYGLAVLLLAGLLARRAGRPGAAR